jgi:hypothetical protein
LKKIFYLEDFETLLAALQRGLNVVINDTSVTLNSFADMCEAFEGLEFFA